jgi:hypothetical protein
MNIENNNRKQDELVFSMTKMNLHNLFYITTYSDKSSKGYQNSGEFIL